MATLKFEKRVIKRLSSLVLTREIVKFEVLILKWIEPMLRCRNGEYIIAHRATYVTCCFCCCAVQDGIYELKALGALYE